MTREAGTSVLELIVASGIMLTASAAAFTLVSDATRRSPRWNDAVDQHQRARVALDAFSRILADAGAGVMRQAPEIGPPAIEPRRRFKFLATTTAITVRHAQQGGASSTLTADLLPGEAVAAIASDNGCPSGVVGCGFTVGSDAAVFDTTGRWHLLSVTFTGATTLGIADRIPGRTSSFSAAAAIVEIQETSLYLDAAAHTLRQEGPGDGDFPLVDNVVNLRFEYLAAGAAPLPVSMFADGPLCGSGSLTYDCDLHRIRTIRARVTIAADREDLQPLTFTADISPRSLQR